MSQEVQEYYIVKYTDTKTGKRLAELFSDYQEASKFYEEKANNNPMVIKAKDIEDAREMTDAINGINNSPTKPANKEKQLDEDELRERRRQYLKKMENEKNRQPKIKIDYESLNTSQRKAYDHMMEGRNIYLCGSAGTGKSYLLQKFMQDSKLEGRNVILTGSTGIAAENIGGITIHKACGIPWNDLKKLIEKDWKEVSQSAKNLLRNTDTLVIDEISMLDYATFEYICAALNHSNYNRQRKGINPTQLIVVGDFLQLPPVVDDRKHIMLQYYPDYGDGYCFESKAWKDMNFEIVSLTEVMRQNEKEYIEALNKLKNGNKEIKKYFNKRFIKNAEFPKNAIYLYGTNAEANRKNANELAKLPGKVSEYANNITLNPGFQGKLNCIFPELLQIKVGARVMAVTNDPSGDFSNGTLGTVAAIDVDQIYVDFDNSKCVPVKKAMEDHFTYSVDYNYETGDAEIVQKWQYSEENFPLKLAYAITIHKSQGQTFDTVIIHPTCFANGQLYVALSRCKTFDGIFLLKEILDSDIKISKTVIDFQQKNGII